MAYRRLQSVPACLAVTLGLLALGLTPAQAVTTASTGWRIVKVIGVKGGESQFNTITTSGKTNAWAGGLLCPDPCSDQTPAVERWNGRSWAAFKLPAALSVGPGIPVVASNSATDTWIFAENSSDREYGVHVTGNHETQTEFPAHISIGSAAVFSSRDAWAFGLSGTGPSGPQDPYATHYNGRQWKHVTMPVAPDGVSGLSSGDLWVYGTTVATLNSPHPAFAVARWAGSRWRIVKLPNLHLTGGAFMQPDSILALNQHDVWADGTLGKGQGIGNGVVLLNWNGKKWISVRPKYALSQSDADITSDGHGGFWVSGYSSRAQGYRGPYIYHYRAGHWTRVLAPTIGRGGAQFGSLAWIPGTQSVWGAAELLSSSGSQAVIYKFGQ